MECDLSPNPVKLLVVEDYDDTRELLTVKLGPLGFIIRAVANGSEAIKVYLETMRCEPAAGILMDLSLPDINGLRVLAAIREIERGSALGCVPIRFAIFTASAEVVVDMPLIERLGVSLILSKPLDADEHLANRVNIWALSPPPLEAHQAARDANGHL